MSWQEDLKHVKVEYAFGVVGPLHLEPAEEKVLVEFIEKLLEENKK
jgi:hypothetical protein